MQPKTITHEDGYKIVELNEKFYGYKWDEHLKYLVCVNKEGKSLEDVKKLLGL